MELISSHWREMLVGFDGTPESLRGIAQLSPRSRNLLHWTFQRRYLAMGEEFPAFQKFLKAGRVVARKQRRSFDLHMLRQCLTLALCAREGVLRDGDSAIVIGDGFGALGSILLTALDRCRVTFINITPVLKMDEIFFHRALPHSRQACFLQACDMDTMPKAKISFDLHCMQEINPDVRARYFKLLSNRVCYSYSCNRVRKTLPDGTVSAFADYPWDGAQILLDGLCPWAQDFYSFRRPFFRKFDGPIQHRLVNWPAS